MDLAGHPLTEKSGRLFFALWPDDATRARLAEWATAFHAAGGGRVTRTESIHLTLAFLGHTSPAVLPAVERAAAGVATGGFSLTVDLPGYWPHNRIAWGGVRHSPQALAGLASQLREALVAARVPFDDKPFVPHITLVRKARPGFVLPALEPIVWPVRGFVLVRSVTGPRGSDYLVQRRWESGPVRTSRES